MIKRISFLFLLCVPLISFASKVDFLVSAGPNLPQLKNNNAVKINEDVTNNYTTNVETQTEGMAGLGVGHTFENIKNQPINIALNLMGYYVNLGQISGIEHPLANLGNDFDTLNYKFNAQSYSVMVEPHFIYTAYSLQPFVLAGIGTTWNHLGGYSETPTDSSGSAAPVPKGYGSHTQTSFAYEFGLGVQKLLFQNPCGLSYFLAIDYRYMNFGKGRLNNFPAMTSGNHLQISNIYTQALAITLKASI